VITDAEILSGAHLYAGSGAVASGTILNGGREVVSSGGIASATLVSQGGTLGVSGGVARGGCGEPPGDFGDAGPTCLREDTATEEAPVAWAVRRPSQVNHRRTMSLHVTRPPWRFRGSDVQGFSR